jgi:putative peptide zinc metalloprotease protein
MALPRLREELDLLPGSSAPDGQPNWLLHDPVRNQFFRIDWPTLEILQRWDLDDPALIAEDVSSNTTLSLEAEDVQAVIRFLESHHLTQANAAESAPKLAAQLNRIQGSTFNWLLHHYLFFRIPLLKPNAWLTRWLPVARLFVQPVFVWMTVAAMVLGFIQVARRWDVFSASFIDTFNLEGILAYGLALIVVKFLHELGHAFTAKNYGCRVPSMGVAFLVLWPVAYTDTNETWRLTDRFQRLRVASAGILTELVIAVWATLAWALLPAGSLQSAAFFLATTSWIATLAINASPFMRFDGYFILMDALDMPNLHARSFELARWKLREWLFDLGEQAPEHWPRNKEWAMIAFAWFTWIYRLILFLGIAVLVYHFFIKAVGIFLFIVEIVWFIAKPINSELKVWRSLWPRIKERSRSRRSALIGLAFCVLVAVPWPGRITASAILKPQESWPVFAPAGARVDELPFQHGQSVAKGQVIMSLFVPEMASRGRTLELKLDSQRKLAESSAFDDELRKRWMVAEQSVITTEKEFQSLQAEQQQFKPTAPYEGQLLIADPDLRSGQWVSKKEPLALLVKQGTPWRVETWLDEDEIARVHVGQSASFYTENVSTPMLKLKLVAVDKDAARTLARRELASALGGHILTREKNGQLVPERAIYRVAFEVEELPLVYQQLSWRGQLVIHSDWASPAGKYLRQLLVVLIRELGF